MELGDVTRAALRGLAEQQGIGIEALKRRIVAEAARDQILAEISDYEAAIDLLRADLAVAERMIEQGRRRAVLRVV